MTADQALVSMVQHIGEWFDMHGAQRQLRDPLLRVIGIELYNVVRDWKKWAHLVRYLLPHQSRRSTSIPATPSGCSTSLI